MNGLVSLPESAGVQRNNGEVLCWGDCGSVPHRDAAPTPFGNAGAMENATTAAAFRVCTLSARTVFANIRHLNWAILGFWVAADVVCRATSCQTSRGKKGPAMANGTLIWWVGHLEPVQCDSQ